MLTNIDEPDEELPDDPDDYEPTGSCRECGCDVYDDDDVCEQCEWMMSGGE